MRRLILMRHAKSDWSFSEPDHARGLNDRGVNAARAIGDWLRDGALWPDEALVSTATRTRQTWGLLGFDDVDVRFVSSLYHANPQSMLDTLRQATGQTVLVLGHNPGICAFGHALVEAPPQHDRFDDYPTCATLVARFPASEWSGVEPGTGRVDAFIVPRDLP